MLETKPMASLNGFWSPTAVVAAAQPDRTTAPVKLGAVNMSLSLPAGAFITTSTKTAATSSHHEPRIFTTLVSALHLARLLSLFLQASLFAPGLLYLGQSASVRAFQAAKRIVYHSFRFSKQAARRLWDSTHGRRLRKKIEFEFFTLILGGGGNNLCLVIFWPGWSILIVATLALSAWYAT
ncbi:hypothetical protein F5B21DRAFT_149454 [Xylaria acuta]|nr:hypothetical protein F5B21DRAFT_149454 [Xylaria acuta]